jgi:diaminopimelate epimerase
VSNRQIPYIKASGCGNTFLLVEQQHATAKQRHEISVRMCSASGAGADGVEWITLSPSSDADVDAVLINADGSEAEISGNGTRCVAAHWTAKHGKDVVRVRTGAGVKECRLISRSGFDFEFQMNVGVPELEGEVELTLSTGNLKGTKLSMGNPQFVVFVKDFEFEWRKRGAQIQAQELFTHGTNVDFVRVTGPNEIEARFFERGVGETQSSGTGSCASAVAAIHSGLVKSPVRVNAVGGAQTVIWDKNVLLRGPARIEQSGVFQP